MPESSMLFLSRRDIRVPPEIASLSRENVVLHVSMSSRESRSGLRTFLGEPCGLLPPAEESKTRSGNLPLKRFSVAGQDSPFSHIRISTPDDGKVCRARACVCTASSHLGSVSHLSKTQKHYQSWQTHPRRSRHVGR